MPGYQIFNDWQWGVYCIQLSNIFKDYSVPTNNEGGCPPKETLHSFKPLLLPRLILTQSGFSCLQESQEGGYLFAEEYWINLDLKNVFSFHFFFLLRVPIWCQWWLIAHQVLGISMPRISFFHFSDKSLTLHFWSWWLPALYGPAINFIREKSESNWFFWAHPRKWIHKRRLLNFDTKKSFRFLCNSEFQNWVSTFSSINLINIW